MIKPELNVNDYIRILKKRKFVILLTVAAVAIFTYIFNLLRPVSYRTQVSLAFNYNKAITYVVNDLAFNAPTNLATMAELATRTSVIEAAAMRLGLLAPGDPVAKRDALVENLKAKISTSVNSNSETITIAVRSSDPVEAADLANGVAEAFRQDIGKRSSEEVRKARLFVETQRADALQKLQAVEDELERFRAQNFVVDISVELQQRLNLINQLELQRAENLTQRAILERRLASRSRAKGLERDALERAVKSDRVERLRQGLLDEEVRAIGLRSRLRADHPEAVAANEKVEGLRRRLENLLAEDFDRELASLQADLEMHDSKGEAYRQVIDEFGKTVTQLPQKRARLERLEQNAAIFRDLVRSYNKKLEEIGVLEAERTSQAPDIINRAPIPKQPAASATPLLMLVGVFGGLILGVFLAFLVETIDVSVSTIEEVEEYLQTPVLGMLPFVSFRETEATARVVGVDDVSHRCITYYKPRSDIAEAFRIVRTNLRFKGVSDRAAGRSLLVTSSLSGEGKTFVAVNLAIIYAQLGARVLLLDANLRDPDIHNHFSIPKNPGITDILIGDFRIDQAIRETPVKNLSLLTSGPIPPNPSELLESPEFRALVAGFERDFDLVIADSPPLLPVADSTIMTTVFKRTMIVHNAVKTGLTVLHRSKATIEGAGARLDGIVLNQLQSTLFMDAGIQVNYYYRKKEEPRE